MVAGRDGARVVRRRRRMMIWDLVRLATNKLSERTPGSSLFCGGHTSKIGKRLEHERRLGHRDIAEDNIAKFGNQTRASSTRAEPGPKE